MEILRDEDLAILAKGKERGYLRDTRLMAQELIARRAGQRVEMEEQKRATPYDYDGVVITVPSTSLYNGPWRSTLNNMAIGDMRLYESLNGLRYIVHRWS